MWRGDGGSWLYMTSDKNRVHTIELARWPMVVPFCAAAMINDWTHSTSDPSRYDIPWMIVFDFYFLSFALPRLCCIQNVSRLRIFIDISQTIHLPSLQTERLFLLVKLRNRKYQWDFFLNDELDICNAYINSRRMKNFLASALDKLNFIMQRVAWYF